jgi:hypothetical protein
MLGENGWLGLTNGGSIVWRVNGARQICYFQDRAADV